LDLEFFVRAERDYDFIVERVSEEMRGYNDLFDADCQQLSYLARITRGEENKQRMRRTRGERGGEGERKIVENKSKSDEDDHHDMLNLLFHDENVESPKPVELTALGHTLLFQQGEADLMGGHGFVVWQGADALTTMLERTQFDCSDLNVCELGTGTGRLGLFFAAAGAQHVTLTDQQSVVEAPLLRLNVESNGLGHNTAVRELDWCKLDEYDLETFPKFDIVVAADCYFFACFDHPLVDSLAAMSTSSTIVYLANNGRWNETFFKVLGEKFVWSFVDVETGKDVEKTDDMWADIGSHARVARCRLRS
jgi:hypothetical protein